MESSFRSSPRLISGFDRKSTNSAKFRESPSSKFDKFVGLLGKLFGFEIKWGKDKTKPPKDWLETYDNAEYKVIDRENYLDFIT